MAYVEYCPTVGQRSVQWIWQQGDGGHLEESLVSGRVNTGAGLEWLDKHTGANEWERTTAGTFQKVSVQRDAEKWGHWLGIRGSREGFVRI